MVDMKHYYNIPWSKIDEMKPTLLDADSDTRKWVSDCLCDVCRKRREHHAIESHSPFSDFDKIVPEETDEPLSDHHYLLMPPAIQGFVLKTRMWGMFLVNYASRFLALY